MPTKVKILQEATTDLQRNEWVERQIGVVGYKNLKMYPRPIPGSAFVSMLKEFDSDLSVWWNRIIHKWQIFWNGKKVHTVQNEDGSYRPLDERVIRMLRRCDSRKRGNEWVLEILQENEEVEASDERSFRSEVKNRSGDVAKWMAKESDKTIGAINLPKEDLEVPDEDVLEQQRQARNAHNRSCRPNYKRREMPYFDIADIMSKNTSM
tara:strand:+ start:1660 stop:2283 length:624 start_codon:yes stop_codon:yes gene_type:complete